MDTYTRSLMANRWKHVASEEDIEELEVRLRPVFGVEPRVYVLAIAAMVVIGLGLGLLLLPGLIRPAERWEISSAPDGAAVYLDGQLIGSTPLRHHVPAGTRTLELVHGHLQYQRSIEARGRLVGSLFLPRRRTLEIRLQEPDEQVVAAAVSQDLADVAAWAITGEASAQFQQPPVAHQLARRIWAGGRDGSLTEVERVDATRRTLALHATPDHTRDLSAALLRLGSPGALMTPASVADLVRFFIQLDNESPVRARIAADLGGGLSSGVPGVRGSAWLEARTDALSTALLAAALAPDERALPSSERRSLRAGSARLDLVRVPAGSHVLGYPLRDPALQGIPVRIPQDFWMLRSELTRGAFRAFLDAEPAWRPERRTDLQAAGLVDDRYLADWPADWRAVDVADEAPLRFVSWSAAQAFVAWLNETVSASELNALLPGGAFVLPDPARWEYAAFLNGLGSDAPIRSAAPLPVSALPVGALDSVGLVGNLWEWTDAWYAPHRSIVPPEVGDQRVVMGGSFASDNAAAHLTGAQPPSWTTPYLGFRVLLRGPNDQVVYDGR